MRERERESYDPRTGLPIASVTRRFNRRFSHSIGCLTILGEREREHSAQAVAAAQEGERGMCKIYRQKNCAVFYLFFRRVTPAKGKKEGRRRKAETQSEGDEA